MIQLSVVAVYLALLLALGLFANRMFRGTSSDYMLASHTIGPFLLLMSLFGTTMTAFALVGSSGEAFKEGIGVYGMLASSSGIIHSLCFFVIGVKLWEIGHRYGYTTQIQFFRDRLANDKIGLLLFPILVGLVVPYLLIGVLAAGTVISSVTEGAFRDHFALYDYGVPPWLGSLVISLVVLIYVFFGGMRGTAWANAFQTIVFMALGVVTFSVIAQRLGEGEGFVRSLQSASKAVAEKHPSKVMRDVAPKELEQYEKELKRWQALAFYNWAQKNADFRLTPDQAQAAHAAYKGPPLPGWQRTAEALYARDHDLLPPFTAAERQEAFLVQDDRVFDKKDLPAGWETMPLSAFPRSEDWQRVAIDQYQPNIGHPDDPLDPADPSGPRKWTRKRAMGIYRATHWAPEEPRPMSKLIFFTYLLVPLSVGMFPHLFQHWLTAKSAASFKLPVVCHPIFIMIVWVPCVLVGIWATSATWEGRPLVPPHFPANAVLAYVVGQLTSPLMGGLLTAGILAAIMSSLDSQFLCIGTMFTNDIVVHHGGPERFSDRQQVLLARSFVVAVVALTYGLSLFEPRRVFVLGVWCFSGFSGLFPLVFAAVYWKRLSVAGAFANVLTAAVVWLVLFRESNFGLNADYAFLGMMPVATIVAASTATMVIVSLITKPPPEATLKKYFG